MRNKPWYSWQDFVTSAIVRFFGLGSTRGAGVLLASGARAGVGAGVPGGLSGVGCGFAGSGSGFGGSGLGPGAGAGAGLGSGAGVWPTTRVAAAQQLSATTNRKR